VDKYRPTEWSQLYHKNLSEKLCSLTNDVPHCLVVGPSGAGKKTRIQALLRGIYGNCVDKLKVNVKMMTTPSNRKIELSILSSNVHIEVTPSDVGNDDRLVIQDLIKEFAQSHQIDPDAKHSFKVVVINEADSLSKGAQAALRRTMEKYMGTIRMILCCESSAKIITPIQSRCLILRVPSPSVDQIQLALLNVVQEERIVCIPEMAHKIAVAAEGNMRKALLILESCHVQQTMDPSMDLIPTDWQVFIHDLALSMLAEQSPARLLAVRSKFYDLLSHCIPASLIIKTLALELIQNLDETLAPQVLHFAAEYEHRLCLGNKAIFHLEAFAAKFMTLYKSYLMDMSDDF